jgi:CRP-like cAMP-binding protein
MLPLRRYGKPRAASVIALTDSSLWYLDKLIFNNVVVRSIDSHKHVKHILRKVQLFSCLSIEQIRQIVGLLRIVKFSAGDIITRHGELDENFYILLKGECESSVAGGIEPPLILKKDSNFNENVLLGAAETSMNTVTAATDVTALVVTRTVFESNIGQLAAKVESYKMVRLATLSRDDAPKKFSDIVLNGLVSFEPMGTLLAGTFGTQPDSTKITVRSYLLKSVEGLKISSAVLNATEAFRVITSCTEKNCFVYRLLAVFHDTNALHLVLNIPVVADLDSLLMSRSDDNSLRTTKDVIIYVATCVFSGLDFLHRQGIIYRSVQPESLYVDVQGKVILGAYRVCKIGKIGSKTYTITGTSEYLAPEQVGRQGHSSSVDFWSLGVVLYELATGVHPFEADTDVRPTFIYTCSHRLNAIIYGMIIALTHATVDAVFHPMIIAMIVTGRTLPTSLLLVFTTNRFSF